MDPITIREIVGWESPAMERVYTHVSPEHVRSQMGKRTSKAFVPAEGEAPNERAVPAVGEMSTDQIRELARRLEEELGRRGPDILGHPTRCPDVSGARKGFFGRTANACWPRPN